MRIQPARRLRGRISLPGDKSISHRAAMIAALADAGGGTRLSNYSTSADCASTLACLEALGVRVERETGGALLIQGAGRRWTHAPRHHETTLDCGNSGTTMRLLAGLLAGQPFAVTLTGDASLSARPMRRIIEPLELMGARVSSTDGRAPLRIEGRAPLAAVSYALPVASAQVKSCVLLAALNADGTSEVIEARGTTRDHTELLLRWFGADLKRGARLIDGRDVKTILINPPSSLRARDVAIPGDISSAAFLLVAAALLPGSDLTLAEVGLNHTRTGIIDALCKLGAEVSVENARVESNERRGELRVRGRERRLAPTVAGANILRGELIANLIDELPVLCVLGTQVEGGLEIRDAAELRVKETDRIGAMVKNLRALGAEVEEYADGLAIGGRTQLRACARLESFGDHRIAMACVVAALIAEGESELEGAEAVGVSFPEFFTLLESVIER